jgi:acylpyruvate hydrolase
MTRLGQFTELSRKIVAVGRNYADHAKELGNAVPSKPLLFLKPPSAYITAGQQIEIPLGCSDLHHEIELGVVIGRQCRRVTEAEAMDYVGGYCLALDMTARDFQEEAKAKGHPWTLAKVPGR